MKALLNIFFMLISATVFAQSSAEQGSVSKSAIINDHFSQYSWVYIIALVALIVVFVALYYFGWDKKMFKSTPHDDNPQLFI